MQIEIEKLKSHKSNNILPPLTKVQLGGLRMLIEEHGFTEPIEITPEHTILDGHNRVDICRDLGIDSVPYQTVDVQDEISYILEKNLNRRQLLPDSEAYIRGAAYREKKLPVGRPNKDTQKEQPGDDGVGEKSAQSEHLKTSKKLEKFYKAGQATIRRDEKYADAIDIIEANTDKDTKAKVLVGDINITKKDVVAIAKEEPEKQAEIIQKIESGEAKNVKDAKKAAKAEAKNAIPDDLPPMITDRYSLVHCDIASVNGQVEQGSIDVIITDPPYPKKYLHLYETLAKRSSEWLKPGGSLLVMTGQSYLPEVLALITPHIQYHWTVAYLTPGGKSAQLWDRNVNTFWKPVLWFVNGDPDNEWYGDVVKSEVNDNDKRFHKWGQTETGMAGLIEQFSYPGNTILDPFLGGGTTGVVALSMNRKFVGIDIDEEAIQTTLSRIKTDIQDNT